MAGSLIKIDEEIVTSAVASVTLTGIDSTYDVYMVRFNNFVPTTDGHSPQMRVTESGIPNTTANYDVAQKNLFADTTFGNGSATNQTKFLGFSAVGNSAGESSNCIMYLFNFNNASEYSFCTWEGTGVEADGNGAGRQGGGVFTSTSACDGVQIIVSSGNIDTGSKFTLYGLKK